MFLPGFAFHTTYGLQHGEPVVLSSKRKVSRSQYAISVNTSSFFHVTKKTQLQALVSALPHAKCAVVFQASRFGLQMFQTL